MGQGGGMKIVHAFPPNFAAIHAVFGYASKPGIVFSYAPDIYTMYPDNIPPEIIAHESVHIERQLGYPGGVEAWWARYLVDREWRYFEELVAHKAEYQYVCQYGSRPARRAALKEIAKKLAAPLYDKMVTVDRAIKDIAA